MTQSMMECAYDGAWLMGSIALLILLLLAVCVLAVLIRGGPFRQPHHRPRSERS